MIKTPIIVLLVAFLLAMAVSAIPCYQETANQSNLCGGLGSGSYNYYGGWEISGGDIIDGDWNTGARLWINVSNANLYINYTKPVYANSAVWQWRDGCTGYLNLSVPDQCFNVSDTLQFWLSADQNAQHYWCNNGTDWVWLMNCSNWAVNRYEYEEAVLWNVSQVNISTCEELQAIQNNSGGYYVLNNDIDCSDTINWNGGEGFIPIGDFSGVFDGNNHTISDLFINSSLVENVGLFGATQNYATRMEIRNLNIVNADVSGVGYIGILAGYIDGIVDNVNVSGTLTATGDYVGGLTGMVEADGTITNSNADVDVVGNNEVGGLVGWVDNSWNNITNCSAVGNVSGYYDTGGLVGNNYGTITFSHATGNVVGNYSVGGLVGYHDFGLIENCYATGSVESLESDAGGLVGTSWENISNSYSTGNVSGIMNVGGFVGYFDEDYGGIPHIENSSSTGNVVGENNAGGFIGSNKGLIFDCYSTGDTEGLDGGDTGGFVAWNDGNISTSYAIGNVINIGADGGFVSYNTGNISDCYSLGNVSSISSDAGGFCGYNEGFIQNSYSIGAVSSGTINVGGFCGYNEVGYVINNSYWDNETSGLSTSFGGEGRNTSDMMTESTFIGWDFVNTWQSCSGWYPVLQVFDNCVCTPDWNCNGWGTCVNGSESCNSVSDLNVCGVPYEGNYSEFTPQGCVVPPYTPSYESNDLGAILVDIFFSSGWVVLTMIGVIVIINIVIYLFNRVKGGLK